MADACFRVMFTAVGFGFAYGVGLSAQDHGLSLLRFDLWLSEHPALLFGLLFSYPLGMLLYHVVERVTDE